MNPETDYEVLLRSAPDELRDMLHRAMDEAVDHYEEREQVKASEQILKDALCKIHEIMIGMGATSVESGMSNKACFVFDLGKSIKLDLNFFVDHRPCDSYMSLSMWAYLDEMSAGEMSMTLTPNDGDFLASIGGNHLCAIPLAQSIGALLLKLTDTLGQDMMEYTAQAREKKRLLTRLNKILQ